ncbi:MAG: hypothetical protein JWR15_276 [Prosthecobacter sp.]|nr:hypothetical protein [Prosthecobacter sp.]
MRCSLGTILETKGIYTFQFPLHLYSAEGMQRCSEWLPRKDSNLERENQNLLCYHYTTG